MESRHKSQALWRRRTNLFGYRYIINGPFMENEKLLAWFQLIAKENSIDISRTKVGSNIKGVVNYFRILWKGKPAILNSNRGSKPIIDECSEFEREF